jgi:hypothetical protein
MDIPVWLEEVLRSEAFATLIITSFAGFVTAMIGWVGIQFRKRILHDLSATDYALLRQIAADAVKYAEQKFKDANGSVKLNEALKAADAMIASYGISVTTGQLVKIIEAAVYAEIAKTDTVMTESPDTSTVTITPGDNTTLPALTGDPPLDANWTVT